MPAGYATNDELELAVYISSQGRLFSRLSHRIIGASSATEEVEGAWDSTLISNFSGQSLSITEPFSGASRQITIEFDPKRGGCTAEAKYVQQPGFDVGSYRSPITKKFIQIKSVAIGETSCSVQNGNVFGGK